MGAVYRAVTDCERLAEEFTADGSVVVSVAVELTMVSGLRALFLPRPIYFAVFHGGS